MEKKVFSKNVIAGLLAAACIAGNMHYLPVNVYAEETALNSEQYAYENAAEDHTEKNGGHLISDATGTTDLTNIHADSVSEEVSADLKDEDVSADQTASENTENIDAEGDDGENNRSNAEDNLDTNITTEKYADKKNNLDADTVNEENKNSAISENTVTDGQENNVEEVNENDHLEAYDKENEISGKDITQTDTYIGENGVVFTYQGHEDGTADIIKITEYGGKDLVIPEEIEGLRTTRILCGTGMDVSSLTIPETIIYIAENAFTINIGTLYYNAVEAQTAELGVSPFQSARIGNFVTGNNVRFINNRIFMGTVFQQENVILSMPEIGERAFSAAKFNTLTLTDRVKKIYSNAFQSSKIQKLCYDTNAEHIIENQLGAVFSNASIHALEIGSGVRELPAYAFHWADMCFDELILYVERIGDYAFSNAWKENSGYSVSLTITDNVKYIGKAAFQHCQIEALELEASVETNSNYHISGIFSKAHIEKLCISDHVDVIPAYMFDNAYLEKEELVLNMNHIGECAFYGDGIRIGKLRIGQNVSLIGVKSFSFAAIEDLVYDAPDAKVPDVQNTLDGPFYKASIGSVQLGNSVTALPDYIFCEAIMNLDQLPIPEHVASIGDYAVCSSSPSAISIGTLTISENTRQIGKMAFGYCTIDHAAIHVLNPPDSPVLFKDSQPVCGNVEIHGNSGYYSYFTKNTDKDNIILLCSDFEKTYGEPYYDEQKGCYITPVTEHCMACQYNKTSEESSDAHTVIFLDHDGTEILRQHVRTGQDAVPPENPQRAGWNFTGWDKDYTGITSDLSVMAQYEIQKYTVTFMDGDTVLKTQIVEYGSDADLPQNPSRPDCEWGKWEFFGWNGSYTHITRDEIIYAQYLKKLNEYEVCFHDAEGKVLDTQIVTHGSIAIPPKAPIKKATVQYTYEFRGWNGDTDNIIKDISLYPVYEARTRSYMVTFMNGETVLDTQKVEYGKSAAAPEIPVKETDDKYIYRFAGWDGDYSTISKDMVIHALFDAEEKNNGAGGDKEQDKTETDSGTDKDNDKDKTETDNSTDKDNDKDKTETDKDNNKDKTETDSGMDKDNDKDKTETDNGTDNDKDEPEMSSGTNKEQNKTDIDNSSNKEQNKTDIGNGTNKEQDKSDIGNGTNKEQNKTDLDNSSNKEQDKLETGISENKDKCKDKTETNNSVNKGQNKEESDKSKDPDKEKSDRTHNKSDKNKEKTGSRKGRENNQSDNNTGEHERGNSGNEQTRIGGKTVIGIRGGKQPEILPQQHPMPIMEELQNSEKEEFAHLDTNIDETDNENESYKEKMEENTEEDSCMTDFQWIHLFAGASLLGMLCIWIYLLYLKKYNIYGVIRNASDESLAGIKVKFKGNGTSATCTDSNGCFCLKVPRTNMGRLTVSDKNHVILSMDVLMKEKNAEDVFKIQSSHCSCVEPLKEKKRYIVNITI